MMPSTSKIFGRSLINKHFEKNFSKARRILCKSCHINFSFRLFFCDFVTVLYVTRKGLMFLIFDDAYILTRYTGLPH